jgi:ketosteroid isomerase-like protein
MTERVSYGALAFMILMVGGSFMAMGQTRDRTASKTKTADQEVRSAVVRWADAVRRRDTAALDRIFARDLFITDYNGGKRGKKEELEILRPSTTTKTMSVTNEELVVRTFPASNLAVVTAIVRMVFRSQGRDTPFAMRYTSVWEKRAGRWQLTVLQTARIAASSAAPRQ